MENGAKKQIKQESMRASAALFLGANLKEQPLCRSVYYQNRSTAETQKLDNSSRGGMFYSGFLRGNFINLRGNTLTPMTSYISLRKNEVIV